MTTLTPKQMRELADAYENDREDRQEVLTALRTAADQLEAVRAWVGDHYHHFPEISELDAILTADTAPQEGRDGVR